MLLVLLRLITLLNLLIIMASLIFNCEVFSDIIQKIFYFRNFLQKKVIIYKFFELDRKIPMIYKFIRAETAARDT